MKFAHTFLLLTIFTSFVLSNQNRTFHGISINDKFCALENGKENCKEYFEYVLLDIVGPWILAGVVCIVAFWVYVLFQLIACTCCGAFKNRCYRPPRGSKFNYYFFNVLIWICLAAFVVAFVFVFRADSKTNSTFGTVRDSVLSLETKLNSTLDQFIQQMTKVDMTNEARNTAEQAKKMVEKIYPKTVNATDTAQDFNEKRSMSVLGVYSLPLLAALLATIASLLKWRPLTLIVGLFCFFISATIWTGTGIHHGVEFVTTDICQDPINLVREYYGNSTALDDTVRCIMGENLFVDKGEQELGQKINSTCKQFTPYCSWPFIRCPNVTCSKDTLRLFLNTKILDSDGKWKDLKTCRKECLDPTRRDKSAEAEDKIQSMEDTRALLEDQIFPLLNCETYHRSYVELKNDLCIIFLDSTRTIRNMGLVFGILLIPLTVASLVGWLTYRKPQKTAEYLYLQAEFQPLLR